MKKRSTKSASTGSERAKRARLKRLREMRAIRTIYEHNAATGIALLLPFTVLLLGNILYHLSIPSASDLVNYYKAWVFTAPVVTVWAVLFPAFALLINGSALVAIWNNKRYDAKVRPEKLVKNIWPSATIVIVSLVVLTIIFGYHASTCSLSSASGLQHFFSVIAGCQQ